MASIDSNVVQSFGWKGVREDLSNIIYNIQPTDTPFMTNIGNDKATQIYTEWQIDTYTAPNALNIHVQGEVYVANAVASTSRIGNYMQFSYQMAEVANTMEATKSAGFSSLMAYEMERMSKILKRDMEAALTSNNAASPGSAGSSGATQLAGLQANLRTNWNDFGTGGSKAAPTLSSAPNGYPNAGAVYATNAAVFTRDMLNTAVENAYNQGAEIQDCFLMLGSFNKTQFSGFTNDATQYRALGLGKQGEILSASDVYVSDFGTFNVVVNRFQPKETAFLVDPNLCAVSFLRTFKTNPVPSIADSKRNVILAEYTLKIKNEAGLASIVNLTTS